MSSKSNEFLFQFVSYLSSNQNIPSALAAALDKRAADNIEKQNADNVKQLLAALTQIAFEWEPEETTTVTTLAPSTSPTTSRPTSTSDATTLRASCLSLQVASLMTIATMMWLK